MKVTIRCFDAAGKEVNLPPYEECTADLLSVTYMPHWNDEPEPDEYILHLKVVKP